MVYHQGSYSIGKRIILWSGEVNDSMLVRPEVYRWKGRIQGGQDF